MKTRVLAMACAALLSLGMVACEGDTATDDGTTTDPATGLDDGTGTLDDPTLDDGTADG